MLPVAFNQFDDREIFRGPPHTAGNDPFRKDAVISLPGLFKIEATKLDVFAIEFDKTLTASFVMA